MKKISKSILLLALCFIGTQSTAQIVALKGGLNLSDFYYSEDLENDFGFTPGFHLGTTFDIPLGEMFAVETGVFATTKGAQIKYSSGGTSTKFYINMLNVEVPLSFKVILGITENVDLYASAGGYIGVATVGVYRVRYDYGDQVEKDTEEMDFDDDGFRRLDYGLTFGAGAEIKGFILGPSFDLGLADIDDSDYSVIRNQVIKFSVGYRFGWDN